MMMEKMIEVPVRFYQLLAAVTLDRMDEIRQAETTGLPIDLATACCWQELCRWSVWHDGAEELGLTRLN